jgi:hypothetical protein
MSSNGRISLSRRGAATAPSGFIVMYIGRRPTTSLWTLEIDLIIGDSYADIRNFMGRTSDDMDYLFSVSAAKLVDI